MEDSDESSSNANSRTEGPIQWGAKSEIQRKATYRHKSGAGNGLKLMILTEKEGGNSPGIRTKEGQKRINSQMILNSMPVHDQPLCILMIRGKNKFLKLVNELLPFLLHC